MNAGLAGRVAIVTGASSGIGRSCAQSLARHGASVVLVARRPQPLAAAVESIQAEGGTAVGVSVDITHADAPAALIDAATRLGGLDIVVNNAGIGFEAKIGDTTDRDFERILATNVTAPFRVLRAAEALLTNSDQARVVNIASAFALVGVARWTAYSAAKGGLVALSRALAIEWARHQICVNVVAPGHTQTEMTTDVMDDPTIRASLERRIPLGRVGAPSDVGGLVAFLGGPEAAWITGQVIAVDGGWSAA